MKKESVILIKDVPSTGEAGERVSVTRGYARNYLIPRGFALADRSFARNLIISKQAVLEKMKDEKRLASRTVKERIEGETLEIAAQVGEEGKLFGAITTMTIHELLLQRDIHVERRHIHLSQKLIHSAGEYHCDIHLYHDVSARLKFKVVPKNEEGSPELLKSSTGHRVEGTRESQESQESQESHAPQDIQDTQESTHTPDPATA